MWKRSGTATLLALALHGAGVAKPPDVPQPPSVRGQVPPPGVQDFFVADPPPTELAPPVAAPRRPLPVVGDWFDSLGTVLCPWRLAFSTGQPEVERPLDLADTPIESLERLSKAARFFELGEILREAGELKLAAVAYAEARTLAPGSRYSQMAAAQIERLLARTVAAKVDEESEPPGTATTTLRYGPFVVEIGKRSLSFGFVVPLKVDVPTDDPK